MTDIESFRLKKEKFPHTANDLFLRVCSQVLERNDFLERQRQLIKLDCQTVKKNNKQNFFSGVVLST